MILIWIAFLTIVILAVELMVLVNIGMSIMQSIHKTNDKKRLRIIEQVMGE